MNKVILKDEITYCWNCGAWRVCKPVGVVKYKVRKTGRIGYDTIHLCQWCRAAATRRNGERCKVVREVDLDELPLGYVIEE